MRAANRGMKRLKLMAGSAISTAFRFRHRGRGSGSRSRSGRKGQEYGNITFQNDEAMIYRRKPAPRRVRRSRRRAMKNFMYRMDKLQSMKTCKIHWSDFMVTSPTNYFDGQAVKGISLYGYGTNTYAANTNTGNGDMWWIFSRENGADPTQTLASRKLRFRSAVLDLKITNTGGDGETYVDNVAYIDIYHVLCRRDLHNDNVATGDIASYWNACINEQAPGNMPTPIVNNQVYDITPFDASGFGRYFKVLKLRRVKLSKGQNFNMQIRDPGNYVLNMEDLLNNDYKANVTEGLIIVSRNPSEQSVGVPGDTNVALLATKTYHYTELSSSIDSIGS